MERMDGVPPEGEGLKGGTHRRTDGQVGQWRGVFSPGGGLQPLLPPPGPPQPLPYFVRRSRLHNLPVYPRLRKSNRRLTELRHVEGDIWALERELRAFLGGRGGKEPEVQVNEVTGSLRFKGRWEGELREWLLQRGF
ncbi:large ribosomal subunit protein mL49 [Phalacrocorax carbo]|uniref:large ribosomal subunit protein mL49 n=1 Tax=Phalacrocorax carbo TaxID=9209 RepID=UPI0031193452